MNGTPSCDCAARLIETNAHEAHCATMAPPYDLMSGWLVSYVGEHTCGGGTIESSYAHEPGCGWEPLEQVSRFAQAGITVVKAESTRVEWGIRWSDGLVTSYGGDDDAQNETEAREAAAHFTGVTLIRRTIIETPWEDA